MSADELAGQDRSGESDHGGAPARRYDSFHVRIWTRPGAELLLRAEVRHLQTDLVDAATAVPVAWVLETLLAALADPSVSSTGA